MPLVRCPHCAEYTFTITGWAELDHCAACGRPLAKREVEASAAIEAKRRLHREDEAIRSSKTRGGASRLHRPHR